MVLDFEIVYSPGRIIQVEKIRLIQPNPTKKT